MYSIENYQNISHELKNAVSVIKSSLQIIEKQHPEVKDFAFWEDTMVDVERLSELTLELCHLRRASDITPALVSITEFLGELNNISQQFLPKHAKLNITYPSTECVGYFDALRMRLAFTNLIKNASEAMAANTTTQPAILSISATQTADSLYFTVSDTGCGMDEALLPVIFEGDFTSKENGTGLGLSITKQIIEAHKGTIEVSSTPNEGTSFSITLPNPPSE